MRQKQANQMEGGEEEAHACITRVLAFRQKKLLYQKKKTSKTLILIFCLIVSNIKVAQLIDITILVGSNHTQPIPHIMLLQILFRQVLQIPANSATHSHLETLIEVWYWHLKCKKHTYLRTGSKLLKTLHAHWTYSNV